MARGKKTIEITSENFFNFTAQQLFDEIERLRGGSTSSEDSIKEELRKALNTINRVENALKEPKPRGRAAAAAKADAK